MKDAADKKTMELVPGGARGRGRPRVPNAKTNAERQAEFRANMKEKGLVPLTVFIPVDLHGQLTKFLQFKDVTKDEVVERFLRQALRKR